MACELSKQCNLFYSFLKCALPEETIDVDLKACTSKGIHKFKKDYKSPDIQMEVYGEQRYNPTEMTLYIF